MISNFIHLILSLFVFLGYLFAVYASSGFVDSPFTWRLWLLPIVLVMTFMFSAGSAFLISSLNVFYEDVKYIVSVLLYLMFFITPVMYFSEQVQAGLKGPNAGLLFNLYHLNPVAMIITVFRRMLLPPTQVSVGQDEVLQPMAFMWGHAGVSFGVCFGMLVFGYWVFNRMKWRFVERP